MTVSTASAPTAADAVIAADKTVTILDDKLIVEDAAVFRWLRVHRLHGLGLASMAMGTGLLPLAWSALTRRLSPWDARQFVTRMLADPKSFQQARLVYGQLPHASGAADKATLLRVLTEALSCGQAWILPVRRIPNRFITKTDPAVLSALNGRFNTRIDFDLLSAVEGGQWLRGYVPFKGKTGHVAGQSGMTVATAFDLGQHNDAEIGSFGFPAPLVAKIKPYLGVKMPHWSIAKVVAEVVKRGPVPILDKAEADMCDREVMGKILNDAINLWDPPDTKGVPAFRALPAAWQTVWLSRVYQEGTKPKNAAAIAFRDDAQAGKWQEAIDQLRRYTEYHDRVMREAAALQAQMPPAVAMASASGAL